MIYNCGQFSWLSVEIHTENNLFRQELKDIKKANTLLLCTVHLLPTIQDQMNTETGMKYYNSSIIIDDTVHSVSGSYHFGPHGEWENFGNQIWKRSHQFGTVEPRLSGLIGTSVNSPDNRESG